MSTESITDEAALPPVAGSPTWREEIEEARELVKACARLYGERDAKEGVTIPPPEFCEDTKSSKLLREAWLEGWNAASVERTHGAKNSDFD